MSYRVKNSISDQETANNGTSSARASSELKLYQAFIFSVPIFFTFILLILFYLFYLRRRRVDWSSMRMRSANSMPTYESSDDISRYELGLKKDLREMLPIIVFKESFFVKETQCSVCLGEYQAEDRLQQIPACGHTFHLDCIDLWLSTHTTCPLCRQSLLASTKVPPDHAHLETNSNVENGDETPPGSGSQTNEYPQSSQQPSESGDGDGRVVPTVSERERHVVQHDEVERGMEYAK